VLFNYLFNQRFILLIQSGFYIDFFLKKICEVFVKNIFIYSSQFFGEKYIIEVLTKKIIDKYIFNSGKYFNIIFLKPLLFFYLTLLILFYIFIFYILLFLF